MDGGSHGCQQALQLYSYSLLAAFLLHQLWFLTADCPLEAESTLLLWCSGMPFTLLTASTWGWMRFDQLGVGRLKKQRFIVWQPKLRIFFLQMGIWTFWWKLGKTFEVQLFCHVTADEFLLGGNHNHSQTGEFSGRCLNIKNSADVPPWLSLSTRHH